MPRTYQISVELRSGGASGAVVSPSTSPISYVSTNTAVVTVDAAGLVTAVAAGTAAVVVRSGAGRLVKYFRVGGGSGSLTTITLTPAPASVAANGTRQFTAAYLDPNGAAADMTGVAAGTWASSAVGIATIDANGLATWVAAGTTNITHTRGGVTSAPAVLTAAAPSVAMVPHLEWWPAVDGYTPRINTVNAVVNIETFGKGALQGLDYDKGDGTTGILTHVHPTGLLSAPTGNERNRWTYYLADRIATTASTAVNGWQQWDRHTRTAAGTVDDWEVRSTLLVGMGTLLGSTDTPIQLRARFRVRGTAGRQITYWAAIVGGATLWPATTLPVFGAALAEQEVDISFAWPTTLVAGSSIDMMIHFVAAGTSWVQGDFFEAINVGTFRAEVFDEPDLYHFPASGIKGTIDFRDTQNNMPIHREKGLAVFRGEQGAHWDGKAVVEMSNATNWTPTNWTVAVSTDNGFYFSRIPAGNPGRFWFDCVVQPGGTLAKAGSFQLLQDTTNGSTALDAGANGTVAGRRVWVHQLWRAAPGQTIPANGSFRATLTGTAAYTGLCRVVRDSATSTTYHVLYPIMVASTNVATAFTLTIENVSGAVQTFQIGPTWPDREVYNAVNNRNAGSPNQWMPPRAFYGTEATGTTATTMKRARIDHGIEAVADVFTNTICRRDFLFWDLEDVRGRENAQLKWFDSGPNASSALTYLAEVITSTTGVPSFRIYIQHAPGHRGSTVEWTLDVGTPNPFRAYAWNDVAVICENGAQAVYINGTWFDRASPNFVVVGVEHLNTVATTLTAAVVTGATSLPVVALSGPIPNAAQMIFTGSDVVTNTTAAVAAGATTIPVVALVSGEASGTAVTYARQWTLNEFTPLWISMDRDLDCALSAFMTAIAIRNEVQTRVAVEGYFAGLNADGRVGQVAP